MANKKPTCTCTQYNKGQCYNCLNGAHSICEANRKCNRNKTSATPFSVSLLKANRKHHKKNVLVYGKMMSNKDVTKWAKIQFKKSNKYLEDINLAIKKLTK